MPEVLRTEIVGAHRLGSPAPSWDAATRVALDHEVAAAEQRAHAAGYAAGVEEATAGLRDTVAAVVGAVDAVRADLAEQRAVAIARDLHRVEAVVSAVLGTSPPPDAAVLAERLNDAVGRLDDPALPVWLHPDDLDALAPLLDDPRVTLAADPSLAPGEARIEGTWGRADLTRAAVTRAVLDALADAGEHAEVDA